jgi:hypothetical protein
MVGFMGISDLGPLGMGRGGGESRVDGRFGISRKRESRVDGRFGISRIGESRVEGRFGISRIGE